MPNGSLESKIDEIHDLCSALKEGQVDQGKLLARLDERTRQHETRIVQAETDCKAAARKAGGGLGAGAGGAAGGFVAVLLQYLGFGPGGG